MPPEATINVPELVNTVLQGGVIAGFLWFVLARLEKALDGLTRAVQDNTSKTDVKMTEMAAQSSRLADAINSRYIQRTPVP